ncbi:MAG: hypothetical protein WCY19_04955 [Candidatus Gastranaerophilaceae bacterium]
MADDIILEVEIPTAPSIDMGVELPENNSIDADVNISITEHDKLLNRNLANQHPISAITYLQSILDEKLEEEIEPLYNADKPYIALKSELITKSDTNHNHSLNNLTEKSYNSLTDKPNIPSQYTDAMAQSALSSQLALKSDKAVEVTHASLYDLINNSELIPEQWYLVTDFKNKTIIGNTTPVELHTGEIEQIYLKANSVSTLEVNGYSKTYANEAIRFQQNPAPILANPYCYAYSDGAGGLYQEGDWHLVPVSDTTIELATFYAEFDTRIKDGSFWLSGNDPVNGLSIELSDSNENDDWEYDPDTHQITLLDGSSSYVSQGFSFLNLIEPDGYVEASFSYASTTFDGNIIGRYNSFLNLNVDSDYRSQLFRRYKPLADLWISGTSAVAGAVYNYNGYVWGCLVATTSSPSQSYQWCRLMPYETYLGGSITIYLNGFSISLTIDSSTYIDYPMFNDDISTLTSPLNITIKAYDTSPVDIIFRGSLTGCQNSTIYAKSTTVLQQILNSQVRLNNCVISTADNVTIKNGANCLINAISQGSTADDLLSTYIYSMTQTNIKTCYNTIFNGNCSLSKFDYSYSNMFCGQCTNSYLASASNNKCYGGFTGNNAYGIFNNNNFYETSASSALGNTFHTTFTYNSFDLVVQYNTFYAVYTYNYFGDLVTNNFFYNTVAYNNATGLLSGAGAKLNAALLKNYFYGQMMGNFGVVTSAIQIQNNEFKEFGYNEFKNGGTSYIVENKIRSAFQSNTFAELGNVDFSNNKIEGNVTSNLLKVGKYIYNENHGMFTSNTLNSSSSLFPTWNIFYRNCSGNTFNAATFSFNILKYDFNNKGILTANTFNYTELGTAYGQVPRNVSGNFTVSANASNQDSVIYVTTGDINDVIATLPPALGWGRMITLIKIDSGTKNVVVTADTSGTADLINGVATYTISGQFSSVTLQDYVQDKWAVVNKI